MEAVAIQTKILTPPKDDLLEAIAVAVPKLNEGDIIAISSKVVAIWQGRCVPIPKEEHKKTALKEQLMRKESDLFLEKDASFPYSRVFTVYEGMFGSSSGIDESNADGYFILLPRHAGRAASDIRASLIEEYAVKDLGVLIVDSKSQVMRNGTIGVSLGHAGFQALLDYRGTKDLFGRTLRFERMNVADCIASTATLAMGEGNEGTPIVLMRNIPHVVFGKDTSDDFMLQPNVKMKEDVFAQFLLGHHWRNN